MFYDFTLCLYITVAVCCPCGVINDDDSPWSLFHSLQNVILNDLEWPFCIKLCFAPVGLELWSMAFEAWLLLDLWWMLSANFKPKRTAAHRAVSLRQHGFLVKCVSGLNISRYRYRYWFFRRPLLSQTQMSQIRVPGLPCLLFPLLDPLFGENGRLLHQ